MRTAAYTDTRTDPTHQGVTTWPTGGWPTGLPSMDCRSSSAPHGYTVPLTEPYGSRARRPWSMVGSCARQ